MPRRKQTAGSTSEKLTVSLPRPLVHAVREEVKARRIASVSSFVAEAVEAKLDQDRLREVLDEIYAGQPMTDEEREWADRYLIR